MSGQRGGLLPLNQILPIVRRFRQRERIIIIRFQVTRHPRIAGIERAPVIVDEQRVLVIERARLRQDAMNAVGDPGVERVPQRVMQAEVGRLFVGAVAILALFSQDIVFQEAVNAR